MTFAALFSIGICYGLSTSVSSTAQANAKLQTLPDSPAIRALKAWLEAFNSGDRTLMEAYYRKYEPAKSADEIMPFRNQNRRL